MQIFIPTRGRVFQETYTSLPLELQKQIHFVTDADDRCISGSEETVLRSPVKGIGPTRQWIIERCHYIYKDTKCVMIDDDLVFATRREDESTKFRESTPEEITTLFGSISACLDSYAHVGVSTREGGNRDTNPYAFNTRLLRVLAYRVDVLRRESIRFDRLELMEDFDVTLQLLRRGYANAKVNWMVHNQRSSNSPGGCSTYRTLEKQSQAARGLRELHPEFVSVVTKKTKTAWNGKERQDVIVQWKRAFCADNSGVAAVLDPGTESDFAAQELRVFAKTLE